MREEFKLKVETKENCSSGMVQKAKKKITTFMVITGMKCNFYKYEETNTNAHLLTTALA